MDHALTARWHDVLHRTGFTGCDIYSPDFDGQCFQEHAVFVSTAQGNHVPSSLNPTIEIVYESNEPKQVNLARFLDDRYQTLTNSRVACVPVDNASTDTRDMLRVFIHDIEKLSLHDMGPELWSMFQKLLISSTSTLWVRKGSESLGINPHVHLIDGIFRVLTHEGGRHDTYIFSLGGTVNQESVYTMIQNILQPPAQGLDTEYAVRDGTFYNSRLIDSARFNQEVSLQLAAHIECQRRFGDTPLCLDSINSSISGGFRSLEAKSATDLGDTDVELKIHCAGLNFRDVLLSLGQIPYAEAWQEGAGVVTRVGNKCTRFKVGDRIVGFVPQPFQGRTVFCEDAPVVHIPPEMSYAEAAGIPTSFLTAWFSLIEVGRIKPERRVSSTRVLVGQGRR
ncbi:hypothetical protein AbraIFM66951_010841 [Aspergillus brasiliensis]|uniref:Enoyl reductase (ER) domain-containing protein n=1 Tax=Aspergillus brasiliensis TaxID=319629 RepID=A0A9W5YJP6_9EURO|nr:hypothetical protein AbraCBS73388_010072 [Aspergillus brasiliensis]GKZ47474.1 hypothetical protein AbraIFM66951_010841 [Aspergillus brasiliensis]